MRLTPKEVEDLTGLSTEMQRSLRKRAVSVGGGAVNGRVSFSADDLFDVVAYRALQIEGYSEDSVLLRWRKAQKISAFFAIRMGIPYIYAPLPYLESDISDHKWLLYVPCVGYTTVPSLADVPEDDESTTPAFLEAICLPHMFKRMWECMPDAMKLLESEIVSADRFKMHVENELSLRRRLAAARNGETSQSNRDEVI